MVVYSPPNLLSLSPSKGRGNSLYREGAKPPLLLIFSSSVIKRNGFLLQSSQVFSAISKHVYQRDYYIHNRELRIDRRNRVAVIEPGITQRCPPILHKGKEARKRKDEALSKTYSLFYYVQGEGSMVGSE